VLDIYASLMTQVTRLNDIREATRRKQTESQVEENDKVEGGEEKVDPSNVQEENRVDTILNDVFQVRSSNTVHHSSKCADIESVIVVQLLSLFFLRIGKSRESPATFCQLGTMKRLLTHRASFFLPSLPLSPPSLTLSQCGQISKQ